MPDDFVEELRRRDAAEAARQRAIAGPQKPRRATKRASEGGSTGGYSETALRLECDNVSGASIGTRNDTLNVAGFNLGQLVAAGELQLDVVERELTSAALQAGLTRNELRQWKLPRRAIEDGMGSPRDMSEKGRAATTYTNGNGASQQGGSNGHAVDWDEDPRRVFLQPLHTVKTFVPQWVWRYKDAGRIQLRTLTMFTGRPAAGKSTAVRWFAAQISNGTLPGCWEGEPMTVAMYSPEEGIEDMMTPSLQVVGANMVNVKRIGIREEGYEGGLLSIRDEHRITEALVENDIRALFVDPVINTFDGSKTIDTHRSSDVRRHLEPYVRIAQAINGIVVCVTHLRKGQVKDVMENINGSSAFGEVPRAVFGFAPVGDGSCIMEQVKNSAGPTGLKLEYHLPIECFTADDGVDSELPRFEIRGETELSITDLGGDSGEEDATTASSDVEWLQRYLEIEQPAPSADVYRTAEKQAGMTRYRDAPHTTAWCLPDFESYVKPAREQDVSNL
jgi:hypothetical protein